MKLICERSESVSSSVIEEDGIKNFYIEGIYLQGDIINGNGRKYPCEVLAREVARYNKTHISKGRAVGELDHPDTPIVSYKQASHKILSLEQDKANPCNFIGKALILDTPNGNIVKGLIKGGVTTAVSSRGVASIKMENNISVVQPDFVLATIDIVVDPSAPDAFMNGIYEGKEFVLESGIWKEKEYEAIRKAAHKKKINEQQLLKEIKKLLSEFL